jgi:hypothetical protein
MNKQLITFASDGLRLSGLLLILTSSLVFGITLIYDSRTDLDAPIFIANYAITVIYTFSLLIQAYSKYRWKFSKSKMSYTIYMLILWFISAFSLNREITIFQSSTNWLSIYICIATATLLLSTFYNGMAKIGKHVCMLLMGSSVVLFVYYAIYLVPFYALGLMGAIFTHTFISRDCNTTGINPKSKSLSQGKICFYKWDNSSISRLFLVYN